MIFGYTENFILMSIMLEYLVPPVFPDICVYTDIPADIVVLFNKQMVYDWYRNRYFKLKCGTGF